MLEHLSEKHPMTLTRQEASEILNVSLPHLRGIIRKGHIKVQDGKIPLGSVANYLCG